MLRFIFAFFHFLFSISDSNIIHKEICVNYFSGTVAPRILKFSTNVVYGLLYCMKENQPPLTYSSLYFIFFLSKFQIKKMSSLFSQGLTERPTKLKVVHTWILDWYIVYTGIRLLMLIYSFISSFFFLSKFQNNFGHTFLRNCEAFKVQTWYAHGQCIDLVFIIYNGLIYCCARWLERESWGIFTRKMERSLWTFLQSGDQWQRAQASRLCNLQQPCTGKHPRQP